MIGNYMSNHYNKFCDYMERDTKGVEIGVYTLSGVIFAVAFYKIRPITKFGKPSDVPTHFIRNQVLQYGTVSSIEPTQKSGPLLKINHSPPLNIFPSKKRLPVKLAGVQINANGYSWLQSVTVNHKVTFVPLIKNEETIECQVFMLNSSSRNETLDLAECLTTLGFANVNNKSVGGSAQDQNVQKYYKNLLKLQDKAKRTRCGLWNEKIPPPRWPLNLLERYVRKVIYSVLPRNWRLPELVR